MNTYRSLAHRAKDWDGADLVERNALNNFLHDLRPEPKVVQSLNYMASVDAAIEWCERILTDRSDGPNGIVDEAMAALEFGGWIGDRIFAPQLATQIMIVALNRAALQHREQS